MEAMDVSDVYYNRFLINGATTQNIPKLHSGDKIRLRIVNGGSSTYFWLQYAGGKITVVAADGKVILCTCMDTSSGYAISMENTGRMAIRL